MIWWGACLAFVVASAAIRAVQAYRRSRDENRWN